jgi:PKD repeat protein
MAIGSSASCSPLDIELNPENSIGVDTFYWHIDYWYGDSSYVTLNKDPVNLYHRDTSITGGPDTLHINLWGVNQWGCLDSFPQRDIVVFPAVHTEFGVDTTEICDADTIGFTNHSIGYKLFYNWDFDDGTVRQDTSSAPFTHNFFNRSDADSVYNVHLTATSEFFCEDEYDTMITVHPFIRANFGIDYDNNCSPLLATFSDLSVRAHFYEWDFGDDSTSTTSDPTFTHPYWNLSETNDTVYYVSLVTRNNEGCSDTLVRTVSVYPHVIAEFDLTDTIGCSPLAVTFLNSSKGGSLSYLWDFGNDVTGTTPAPSFVRTYSNPAQYDTTYIITLTASNPYGCDSSVMDSVTVFASIDADFVLPVTDSCPPFTINPENTSSVGAHFYTWELFNDSPSPFFTSTDFEPVMPTLSNSTSVPDTIITMLRVSGDLDAPHMACADTHSIEIIVYPLVTADFTSDPIAFCSPDIPDLINNSVNADMYVWDFDDGSGSTAEDPTHEFENFHNINDVDYTIDLLARSVYNCTDDTSVTITVYAKPSAEFYLPDASDCPPFELQMTDISIGSNLSYLWNFDGDTSTLQNPLHTFDNESTDVVAKPITLTVTSDKGCTDFISKQINVYPNVRVAFTSDVTEGCSPLEVQFTGDTVNVSSMLWYMNGQAFSPQKDPSLRLVNDDPVNAVYEITFSAVSEFDCFDDTTGYITVFPGPTAEFIPQPMIQSYNTESDQTPVTFRNETYLQSEWVYEWDYGDGSVDSETAGIFDHDYEYMFWGEEENNYYFPVQLVAWNSENPECRDTIIREIQIRPPVPEVELEEDISACVPFTLDFYAVAKYVYPDQYEWDFGDGTTSTDTFAVHTFDEPGVYTVRLEVNGDGGPAFDDRIVYIYPRPTAAFTFNDSSVFTTSQDRPADIISFYNQTSGGADYWWFFTNQEPDESAAGLSVENAESIEMNPTWSYEEQGTYYVALIAQSDLGCYDTIVNSIPIYVLGDGNIQFPTAFTVDPAGAGNEWVSDPADMDTRIFRPFAQGIEEYKLEIYNRWGVLVFKSNDVNHGWNGYLQGRPAKQDVYMWRAKGRFTNGQPFEVSGDVTLLIVPREQY